MRYDTPGDFGSVVALFFLCQLPVDGLSVVSDSSDGRVCTDHAEVVHVVV